MSETQKISNGVKIIYEDNDILVINKPAGLIVHGADESVASWVLKNYPQIKNVGEDPERPGIVHRLDKDTSGILLVAKNQKTFEYLKEQFSAPSLELKKEGRDLAFGGQTRKIKKTYLALVHGIIKNDKGLIELNIGKSKRDFRKKTTQKAIGKIREATTEYKVLKTIKHPVSNSFYTLVEACPRTGRMHQIRVHFKAISHPVVCDKLYGRKKEVCPFGLTRQFLHASSLELNLPSGARIKLEADIPDDLQNVLNMLDLSS